MMKTVLGVLKNNIFNPLPACCLQISLFYIPGIWNRSICTDYFGKKDIKKKFKKKKGNKIKK